MNTEWCLQVYEDAIKQFGYPKILNMDQGSQFTKLILTKASVDQSIKFPWMKRGKTLNNIFIERFWRTLKYEYIYLNPANEESDL
jgi:putative transposase